MKLTASLATCFDVTVQTMCQLIPKDSQFIQYGQVYQLEGGDVMHAHKLNPFQSDSHDMSYVLMYLIWCMSGEHLRRCFRVSQPTLMHTNTFRKTRKYFRPQMSFTLPEIFAKLFHYYSAPTLTLWPESHLWSPHAHMCISHPHYMAPHVVRYIE
jgi:hypothetical protein